MTVKPYPEYRESGYEWFGQVPSHWTVTSMKRRVDTGAGSGFPHEYQDERDGDIPFLKVNSLAKADADGVIRWSQETVSKTAASVLRATVYPAGSIVVAKIGAALLLGRIRVLGADSCIDNNLMALAPLADTNSRFLYYAMTLVDFNWLVNPGAVPSTSEGAVGQFPLPFPPFEEQAPIADYLDAQTAKIDLLIGKQEQLIETLAERRQVVISRAVTKGLDPNAPMKESGIYWLGEIPSTWSIRKFSQVTRINGGQVDPRISPYKEMTLIAPNHIQPGTGRLLYSESSEEQGADSGKYLIQEGQVIYSKIRPVLRKATIAREGCLCSADMYGIEADQRLLSNEFLLELMLSRPFTQFVVDVSMRVAMPKVNRETLAGGAIWFPSLDEQADILAHINRETAQIDQLSAKAREMIDVLKERRQALISAAVTGKIDVRGLS